MYVWVYLSWNLFPFILDSKYEWNCVVFVFLCLTYLTWYSVLKVHPCWCKWQDFILLYGWVQYSCLENPMGGGAWWATVHGVAKSQTWLSNFTFTFHFHALEKEMATHSIVLAWRIPGTGEPGGLPGGLPSMGSHRVGYEWSDLAAAAAEAAAAFHCKYMSHLFYSFFCWWALRFFPCLGYFK